MIFFEIVILFQKIQMISFAVYPKQISPYHIYLVIHCILVFTLKLFLNFPYFLVLILILNLLVILVCHSISYFVFKNRKLILISSKLLILDFPIWKHTLLDLISILLSLYFTNLKFDLIVEFSSPI